MADIGTKNILWGGLLFLTWLIFNVNDYKIVGTLCSRVQSTICSYNEEPRMMASGCVGRMATSGRRVARRKQR